jgi:hypothetical protein
LLFSMAIDHTAILSAVMHTGLSTAIRESTWAVMAFESVHLIGLTLLGGPAILIGIAGVRRDGLRGLSVSALSQTLLPILWIGLSLMAASGLLITVSMPFKYYNNMAFRWKMVLLVLALATTAALLRVVENSQLAASSTGVARQRGLAFGALILWFGVGFSGRLIGFL